MAHSKNSVRRFLLGILFLPLAGTVAFNVEPLGAQVHGGDTGEISARAAERIGSRSPQFEAMAQGQAPGRLFITCSDSRLIPAAITWTGVGELFVIRNAGNIVPPYDTDAEGVTATVEYAVAVLEVPTIVVCGHTQCGAMKAALDPTGLDTVPNVRNWIKFVEPARLAVDELHPRLASDARWLALVEQNVLQQLTNLKTHPWVAARAASGRLRLEGWVYDLNTRKTRILPFP